MGGIMVRGEGLKGGAKGEYGHLRCRKGAANGH